MSRDGNSHLYAMDDLHYHRRQEDVEGEEERLLEGLSKHPC